MNEILAIRTPTANVKEYVISAPAVARHAHAGQFIILRVDADGERVPFTICDYDSEKGTVTILVQTVGYTTKKMDALKVGDYLHDFVGPLGNPTDLSAYNKVLLIGGGIGSAVIFPQAKVLKAQGKQVHCILGARTAELVLYKAEFEQLADKLYVMTDDGSLGERGLVTNKAKQLFDAGEGYDAVFAVGPMIMMKFVCLLTKEYSIPTVVSMNSIMLDGTGMCGGCRVTVGGQRKYACVDGPEFDGHAVDFDEALSRLGYYKAEEQFYSNQCDVSNGSVSSTHCDNCRLKTANARHLPINQNPAVRVTNFNEVSLGFDAQTAIAEAQRCLNCKNPTCEKGCPVNVKIPAFIHALAQGDIAKAGEIIKKDSNLPAICGRVCPQEVQCEKLCIRNNEKMGGAVAIGTLERFVADFTLPISTPSKVEKIGKRVAVIGSGPASLTCAADLAQKGVDVTIFEAFHKAGGVLVYGIPEFRLPKALVQKEIDKLLQMGVNLELNVVVGKTITVEELRKQFDAIFIGTGAGLPMFLGIPGESLSGVFSANEYLTRINLMKAYDTNSPTPMRVGRKVVVVGAGNVAMDAARTAKRLGAAVTVVYRRSREEMPARGEEIEHALEEGIDFQLLTNPCRILGEKSVSGIECVRMCLGEPDASGRRRPVEIPDSTFVIDCEQVIVSLGTSPNPLLRAAYPHLNFTPKGTIAVDEATLSTSVEGIYAGGDAVTGAATVILAMGAGKKAAANILSYLEKGADK